MKEQAEKANLNGRKHIMLKVLRKKAITLALVALTLCAMGTHAQAEDIVVNFDNGGETFILIDNEQTNGGWTEFTGNGGGTGTDGVLNWAARGIKPPDSDFRKILLQNDKNRLQFNTWGPAEQPVANTQGEGTFVLIDFAAVVVENFLRADMRNTNNNVMYFRTLIRETITNKWYASDELLAIGTDNVINADAAWTEVTNAEAIGMNAAVVLDSATFTQDLFEFAPAPTDISGGINIDRAGIYITRPHPESNCNFNGIIFEGLPAGAEPMPDIRGMTEAEAKAALDALVTGLTYVHEDRVAAAYFPGSVTATVPDAGELIYPDSEVTLGVTVGEQQTWVWTGAAGTQDAATAGNWSLAETFHESAVNARLFEITHGWPSQDGERVAVGNGDLVVLGSGQINGQMLFTAGNSTLIITGSGVLDTSVSTTDRFGAALNAGRSWVGHAGNYSHTFYGGEAGNGDATVLVENGGTWFARMLSVGHASPLSSCTARLVIRAGGTIDITTGAVNIGEDTAGEPKSVGILEIGGTGALFETPADLRFKSPGSTLKFVADATGFGLINCVQELELQSPDTIVEIDASLYTGAEPATFTLTTGRNDVFLADAGILTSATITPPVGGSKADWTVVRIDTDGDDDLDGLAAVYAKATPAKLVSDPVSELALDAILLDTGATNSNGTVTVTNTGATPLSVTASVTGEGFTIESPTTYPQEIRKTSATGDTLEIVVAFDTALLANLGNGTYTGTLTLESNSDGEPSRAITLTVDVSGFTGAGAKKGTMIIY